MLRLLVVGLAVAAPAGAVTVLSESVNSSGRLRPGETMLMTFDAPAAPGVILATSGRVIEAAGTVRGLRTAVHGAKNRYLAITAGGSATFDFAGVSGGRPLGLLSFDWGSIDSFNRVEFLDARGALVAGFDGGNLPVLEGRSKLLGATRRLLFSFAPQQKVTGLRLSSGGNAFEVDNIAAGGAVVPEPEDWLLLIIGFALIGGALRRRRARAVA